MLLKKYKVESYTVHEFLNREEFINLDRTIEHIQANKNKYMLLVTIIALTIDLSTITSFAMDTTAIDKAGMQILELIRKVGYWIGIILCSKDVIKHCMRGHLESIGTIVAMYGLGFGVLYFLPWLFDLIKGLF